jgi:hypothetical protein
MSEIENISGLTAQEVLDSRRSHGSNILTPPPQPSLWSKFFH